MFKLAAEGYHVQGSTHVRKTSFALCFESIRVCSVVRAAPIPFGKAVRTVRGLCPRTSFLRSTT